MIQIQISITLLLKTCKPVPLSAFCGLWAELPSWFSRHADMAASQWVSGH